MYVFMADPLFWIAFNRVIVHYQVAKCIEHSVMCGQFIEMELFPGLSHQL